jgi:hypothetical protein
MKQLEWTFVDKSAWLRGPWDSEPDKLQWTDEATGLPCLVHRGPCGALCGYVGVAEGHPWFEKAYEVPDVTVYGGLTFADFCAETSGPDDHGICHLPEPGEPERVWWLGFDCAHVGDFCPGTQSLLRRHCISEVSGLDLGETYRDLPFVRKQCAALAAQVGAQ